MSASVPARLQRSDNLTQGWIATSLRQQGIPVPSPATIEAYLAALVGDDRQALRERLARFSAATASDSDVRWMISWSEQLRAQKAPDRRAVAANDIPAPTAPAARRDASAPGEGRVFEQSHHVYATRGALCFEPVEVPGTHASTSYWTVQVEAAAMAGKGRAEWDKKIAVRLTRRELPIVTAAMLGWCPKAEISGHGAAADKRLTIEHQGERVFVKVGQGRRTVAVPVSADDLTDVAYGMLKALRRNMPELDSQTVLQLVKAAGSMATLATTKTDTA